MNPEQPQPEKIKRLFGHCFEILKFEQGDKIPVGGESIFSPETNIQVVGDFENFKEFFQEALVLAAKYDLPKLKEWLASKDMEVDEKIFAELFAFTKKFEQRYPQNPNSEDARRNLYKEKGKELKLSDVFNANSEECAETAALAQTYLQQGETSSSYFSGEVLWDKDQEFSEAHSFIVIRQGEKFYIYDPANPTDTTSGNYPSLYTVEADFDAEMAKGQKKFVAAKNILSKKKVFFGVNDGSNIIAERNIIEK